MDEIIKLLEPYSDQKNVMGSILSFVLIVWQAWDKMTGNYEKNFSFRMFSSISSELPYLKNNSPVAYFSKTIH